MVLFDDARARAEVFLPGHNNGMIMLLTNTGNWEKGEYRLVAWKGYVLQQNEQPVFGGE